MAKDHMVIGPTYPVGSGKLNFEPTRRRVVSVEWDSESRTSSRNAGELRCGGTEQLEY